MGQRDTVISGAVAGIAAMLQMVYDAGMAEAREKAAGRELPARLLEYTEILDAPELSVLYEEVRVDWGEDAEEHDARVETEIAPVEKRGGAADRQRAEPGDQSGHVRGRRGRAATVLERAAHGGAAGQYALGGDRG